MSRIGRIGFFIVLLVGAVFAARADKPRYNLLDVYHLALKNDLQLASAHSSMKATRETKNQSRSALFPRLGLSANTQHNRSSSEITNGSVQVDRYNSHGWGATFTQPLFNMNSWYNHEFARSVGEQASIEFAHANQQLILRVAEAYFNVLRFEDSLMTAKSQEKALKQQLDQASERYKVGLSAETDVHDARAAYDNARVERIQADNQVSVGYEQLRTIVKQEVADIAKLEKTMPVVVPTPTNPEHWVQTALVNNLELKAAREGLQANEYNIKTNKSGHLPTVNAFASYNYSSSNAPQVPATLAGDRTDTIVGVQVDFALFSGGADISATRQAGYQLEAAQKQYDQQLRNINANIRSLLRTVTSDVDRVYASCKVITSSKSALKATQSGYDVGTRNITDVLNSQQKLYTSLSQYLNTRYDFIMNTLQLKQAAGTLSPTDLEILSRWMSDTRDQLSIPDECDS